MDSAMNEILRQLAATNPPKIVDPDPVPTPFTFSTALDKAGVLLESPGYVKKNCKLCYGRGFQTYLIGDGYIHDGKNRSKRKARNNKACQCVVKGYKRACKGILNV